MHSSATCAIMIDGLRARAPGQVLQARSSHEPKPQMLRGIERPTFSNFRTAATDHGHADGEAVLGGGRGADRVGGRAAVAGGDEDEEVVVLEDELVQLERLEEQARSERGRMRVDDGRMGGWEEGRMGLWEDGRTSEEQGRAQRLRERGVQCATRRQTTMQRTRALASAWTDNYYRYCWKLLAERSSRGHCTRRRSLRPWQHTLSRQNHNFYGTLPSRSEGGSLKRYYQSQTYY
eukprot:1026497-Rhodomonas_salina.1